MAHGIGLRTIAEGVETAAQVAILKKMGCEYLQGFYFGKPQILDEITKVLENIEIT